MESSTATTISLSARGSISLPKSVIRCWVRDIAIHQSVMLANINNARAGIMRSSAISQHTAGIKISLRIVKALGRFSRFRILAAHSKHPLHSNRIKQGEYTTARVKTN